ncbi:heavy metal translocating P-type ATPase [Compostibacter hankyongensis]|uniref:P-type Zn(2+) transporter n=1 Tax=Compostibacter hankyongensis TaxID=1007089 RepID=A0ABP8FI59_9BACT
MKKYLLISFLLLLAGIGMDTFREPLWFRGGIRLCWYILAYLPVGLPVLWKGIKLLVKGNVFTEFFLMSLATLGAFYIGKYPEGVAVMLFYTVGELFQEGAVGRAKRSIRALLDIRPERAAVFRDGRFVETDPAAVRPGEQIQVKAGERVPLDGMLLDDEGVFNAAALTGESRPAVVRKEGAVLAGMINAGNVVRLKVTRVFDDSALARILALVQEATARKAKTEQFIRKFSRIYTPVVVVLALLIVLVPFLIHVFTPGTAGAFDFNNWLYRALIFLVISCPCALVVSIPLGYFGGIGAASRNGILFKGSNFLDIITRVNTVVMDKTGTLTQGVFAVQQVQAEGVEETELIRMLASLEQSSTHPAAKAIVAYAKQRGIVPEQPQEVREISGRGIGGMVGNKKVLAGNIQLMREAGVSGIPDDMELTETVICCSIGRRWAGYLTVADRIKPDAAAAVAALQKKGIAVVMLSGDRQAVVDKVARELGISEAYGGLLPEDKVRQLEIIRQRQGKAVAFVGDGINDAPVLAMSEVGIAMGGLGSDVAIETADVIIQTDHPSRIPLAMAIGRATRRIVWQNITLAFAVKLAVLALGAGGLATMWEAVFADVGVALLAILNAIRIQHMKE